MPWLKEHIGTVAYPGDCASVFNIVLRKLERLSIPVEEENEQSGTSVARCLSRPIDLLLWRCWSERLMIQIKNAEPNKTSIRVYALPNLFRTAAGRNPRESKLDDVLTELGRIE